MTLGNYYILLAQLLVEASLRPNPKLTPNQAKQIRLAAQLHMDNVLSVAIQTPEARA